MRSGFPSAIRSRMGRPSSGLPTRRCSKGLTLAGTLDLIAQADLTCRWWCSATSIPSCSTASIASSGRNVWGSRGDPYRSSGRRRPGGRVGGEPELARSDPADCPDHPAERLRTALDDAQGFVYLVARLGVTGARSALAADLAESLARVRQATPPRSRSGSGSRRGAGPQRGPDGRRGRRGKRVGGSSRA